MTTIIGLDPSLSSTGLARITGPVAEATSVPSKGRRADSLGERWQRQQTIATQVYAWALPANLLVVEGYFPGRDGSQLDRWGLWWELVGTFLRHGIPVVEVPPSRLKKWATGKGAADKAAMGGSMARMWPDVECRNSDEVDALALASMGAHMLGLVGDQPVYRQEIVNGMPSPFAEMAA